MIRKIIMFFWKIFRFSLPFSKFSLLPEVFLQVFFISFQFFSKTFLLKLFYLKVSHAKLHRFSFKLSSKNFLKTFSSFQALFYLTRKLHELFSSFTISQSQSFHMNLIFLKLLLKLRFEKSFSSSFFFLYF